MPWYVEMITTPTDKTGNVTAVVAQYANAAAFENAVGAPVSVAGIPGETSKGYPTKAAAQKAANAWNKSGAGKAATGSTPSNDFIGAGTPGLGGGNPLTGLAAIGDFFARLSEANTWLRIGEGLLGVILIAVGVARLTHAVPIATKIAGAVA